MEPSPDPIFAFFKQFNFYGVWLQEAVQNDSHFMG